MNIKEAKIQIKNAITAYLTKNEFGEYVIPTERQRPIFLMGAPGIGKTAIMEQISSELGIGLVCYSMTHHTRQSALGLPFIVKKNYGGVEYDVSEYTMSEIIASVYDMIEGTGCSEGILFLDEINCVSETLAPAMLQFLQYKIFGRHKVPCGWVVVTAGNPPEYNNSVRDFDIVTWDRLKRIDVEADFEVWKEFALNTGIHSVITTYLDIKKSDFYKVETTVRGKSFVTARAWSDLSDMIKLYEKNGIDVDIRLISQYVQDEKVAKDFAIYYDLYNKYKSDYQIDKILAGESADAMVERAQNAKFDERIALIGLLLDVIYDISREVYHLHACARLLTTELRGIRSRLNNEGAGDIFDSIIKTRSEELSKGKMSSSMSRDDIYAHNLLLHAIGELAERVARLSDKSADEVFECIKKYFNSRVSTLRELGGVGSAKLSYAFRFLERAFGDGQEILIFVTELTVNQYTSSFISRYGCPEYFAHNKELLLYERHKDIIREIELLDIDDI